MTSWNETIKDDDFENGGAEKATQNFLRKLFNIINGNMYLVWGLVLVLVTTLQTQNVHHRTAVNIHL